MECSDKYIRQVVVPERLTGIDLDYRAASKLRTDISKHIVIRIKSKKDGLMLKPAILIAGDLSRSVKRSLLLRGLELMESWKPAKERQCFKRDCPDLVIVGDLPGSSRKGIELARKIRRIDSRMPIVLITSSSSEEQAIAALKIGINDYFKEPPCIEELLLSIERLLPRALSGRSGSGRPAGGTAMIEDHRMVGDSEQMQEVKRSIVKIARAESTVLITGETGTGKELAAELIHKNSNRSRNPFVCINCAAIPDSLFESELFGYERGAFTGAHIGKNGLLQVADGGTVLLDEIGDLSSYGQAKVLRVIEKGEVNRLGANKMIALNIRLLAATNYDLERLVQEKKFRIDLYFRLNVARVILPPLRERKEDIPILVRHYIQEFNPKFGLQVQGFTESALTSLIRYNWPGNIRELKNLVEATFVNLPHKKISFMELPVLFRKKLSETSSLPQSERDRLLAALFFTNWNKSKAAKELQWSRMTLYRKMVQYRIKFNQARETA